MPCSECCPKDECSVSYFRFEHPRPEVFVTPQWHMNRWFYTAYRVFFAVYWLIFLILSGATNFNGWYSRQKYADRWFAYLTSWNSTLLSLSTILQAVCTIHYYWKEKSSGTVVFQKMPIRFRVMWFLYNLSSTGCCVITSLYWPLQYPGGVPDVVNLHLHAINTIYVIIDVIISRMPFKLQHIFFPMLYATVYLVFGAVYQSAGGRSGTNLPYIYKALDWRHPERTAILCVLAVLLVTPFFNIILFGLSMAREKVSKRCLPEESEEKSGLELSYERINE